MLDNVNGADVAASHRCQFVKNGGEEAVWLARLSQRIVIGLSTLKNLANESSVANAKCSIKKTRCLVLSVLVLPGALFSSDPVLQRQACRNELSRARLFL